MHVLYVLLEVDPNIVKPGWTPLIITILLAAVIALLMISMRRHLRKINLPHRDQVDDAETSDQTGPPGGAESHH
jgi:hypothetical protein